MSKRVANPAVVEAQGEVIEEIANKFGNLEKIKISVYPCSDMVPSSANLYDLPSGFTTGHTLILSIIRELDGNYYSSVNISVDNDIRVTAFITTNNKISIRPSGTYASAGNAIIVYGYY